MEKEIITINEYGYVEIELKSPMDAKGITRNAGISLLALYIYK